MVWCKPLCGAGIGTGLSLFCSPHPRFRTPFCGLCRSLPETKIDTCYFIIFPFGCCNRISCGPGWTWTHYVAESCRCGGGGGARVCGRVGLAPHTTRLGRACFLGPLESITSSGCPHGSPLILTHEASHLEGSCHCTMHFLVRSPKHLEWMVTVSYKFSKSVRVFL